MWVLHKCDVPACVRPSHLYLGNVRDNAKDMVARGQIARGDRNGMRTKPESRPVGSKNGRAKLTEVQVTEIRRLRSGGVSSVVIAEQFGISQSHARNLGLGLRWSVKPTGVSI